MPEIRFCADPAQGFSTTPLDAMTALYHRRSGQTHIVAEPVPEILAALGGKALDVDALLAALGVVADAKTRAAIGARLDELEAAGLVSRA